jgi:D-xylose transport system substrate-binding protein
MKTINLIHLITVVCFLSFVLPASSQKIGLALANQYSERWIKEATMMTEKLQQLGATILMETAEDNMDKQLAQAQKLIDEGVKVLVVVSVDCAAAAKIVEIAHKAGVIVIAYDRLILNSDLDYYISFNSIKVGELLASYVFKLKPTGNYIFINGPTSDFNSKLIREGVMNILEKPIKQGSIKLLLDKNLNEWAELEGYMEMSTYLNGNNPKPDAVITGADLIGVGAANALDENKLSTTVSIVGQDADLQACKGIVNGKYGATVLKSHKNLVNETAMLAYKLAKKETISDIKFSEVNNGKINVPSRLLEPVLVDKSNIDKEIIQSGHLTHEQLYQK